MGLPRCVLYMEWIVLQEGGPELRKSENFIMALNTPALCATEGHYINHPRQFAKHSKDTLEQRLQVGLKQRLAKCEET